MTFVSPWPIRFHDGIKLECSSQQIPRAVVLGLLELNCDWLKIPTSQKSFPGSGSQTLFSAESSDNRNTSAFTGYIALSHCEIYDDVMVLIWKFARDMPMNDTKRKRVSRY